MRFRIAVILFGLALVPLVRGEDAPPPKPEEKAPAPKPDGAADPTAEDEAIRRAREAARGAAGGSGPDRELPPPVVPATALRGVVEIEGRPPAALIEVAGQKALVHVGDKVLLPVREGAAPARRYERFEVLAISEDGVTVRFTPEPLEVIVR